MILLPPCYYGESSLNFLCVKAKKVEIVILKIVTLILLVVGSVISSSVLWFMVDIMVGVLAIINIYALFSLRKIVIEEYKCYKKQKNMI